MTNQEAVNFSIKLIVGFMVGYLARELCKRVYDK